MARVPLVSDKNQLAPEHHEIFDEISSTRGAVAGPFALLLHDPPLAARVAHLGSYLRFESPLLPRERELVILTVASEMRCEYEWHFHLPLARQAGVPEDIIACLQARTDPPPGEAPLVPYVRNLLAPRRVDPHLFETLVARLGVPGLVTLTATAGYYAMLACLLNAFDVRPGSTEQP
jgi:4-carboxymuconolactone decarboxylase